MLTSLKRLLVTFLSTPSARRATWEQCPHLHRRSISIHALREEGDFFRVSFPASSYNFYPRPPRGGRRLGELHKHLLQFNFYPRPPRGGRLEDFHVTTADILFLSTPSARRATLSPSTKAFFHSFLSTPSARRATSRGFLCD